MSDSTITLGNVFRNIDGTIASSPFTLKPFTSKILINDPTPIIIGTTPASRCGTGTITLGATASAGTINWYSSETGGTSLGTGTSFTTQSISSTTTYYVDATNNGYTTSMRTAVIATVKATPSTPTAANNGTVCVGLPLQITASTITGATYSWTGPNGFTSTMQNPTVSSAATTAMSGTYSVTASVNGCTSSTNTTTVIINTIPATPSITQNGSDLVSSSITGNQWYDENGAINGATSDVFTPTESGDYYVVVTQNGCQSLSSNIINVIYVSIINTLAPNETFNFYPNPVSNELIIETNSEVKRNFEILNYIGQSLYSSTVFKKAVIDMSQMQGGIYLIKINTDKITIIKRFVKQ
jgi:hypothetical protein